MTLTTRNRVYAVVSLLPALALLTAITTAVAAPSHAHDNGGAITPARVAPRVPGGPALAEGDTPVIKGVGK